MKKRKKTVFDFSKGTIKVFSFIFCFNITQYNTLNGKLSNSQINKLKSGIKNGTEVTLNISSNIVGGSNDEDNFPHNLLLTNT